MTERTIPAAMTLRLRKYSQAELVAGMAKANGYVKPTARVGSPMLSRGNAVRAVVSPLPISPDSSAAADAEDVDRRRLTESSAMDFKSVGRPVKAPMLSPRSSPAAAAAAASEGSGLGLTLEAFASSLASEEGAKPLALQPLMKKPPLALPSLRVGSELMTPPSPSSAWQDISSMNGLLFEVELWRADLLTSVLEMDKTGKLVGGGLANPLCPPGEHRAHRFCASRFRHALPTYLLRDAFLPAETPCCCKVP